MKHRESSRFLDYFLPGNLLEFQVFEDRRRGRLLIRMSFLLVLIGLLTANQSRILAGELSATVIAILFICFFCALNPVFLKVTGKVTFVSALLCTEWLGLLAFVANNNGGLTAPAATWLPILPLMAFMLGGKRLAFGIACLTVLLVTGFFAAEKMGVVFSETLPSEAKFTMLFVCLIGEIVAYSCFLLFLEKTHRSSSQEKEQLSRQIERKQHLATVGTLAGGAAHSFNNLLWVISGNAEQALRKISDEDPLRKHLTSIVGASDRAVKHVDALQKFSRGADEDMSVFELSAFLNDYLKVFQERLFDQTTLIVEPSLDEQQFWMKGFPSELGDAIRAIVTNSTEAMPEKGVIKFTLQRLDAKENHMPLFIDEPIDCVQLKISDTGVGMTQEVSFRAVDPFFTTKDVGQGVGLGLSIAYGIVRSMRGNLKIESRVASQPEHGTTITLTFPVVEANELAAEYLSRDAVYEN